MNKVYAVSDLHGMYNLWEKIKNYIDETDTIYFLGDAADRGPDGMKLMKELMTDKRVIYLLGNHEDIMSDEAPDIMEGRSNSWLWGYNGGGPTISAFELMSEDSQRWILNKINNLPREVTYINKDGKNIFMCHAGTHFGWTEFKWEQHGMKDAFIWDRSHLHMDYDENKDYEWDYIIHGHTPTPALMAYGYHYIVPDDKKLIATELNPYIIKYCNGRKIDIDLGCFFTKKTCLLDLDTLEPIYFDV